MIDSTYFNNTASGRRIIKGQVDFAVIIIPGILYF